MIHFVNRIYIRYQNAMFDLIDAHCLNISHCVLYLTPSLHVCVWATVTMLYTNSLMETSVTSPKSFLWERTLYVYMYTWKLPLEALVGVRHIHTCLHKLALLLCTCTDVQYIYALYVYVCMNNSAVLTKCTLYSVLGWMEENVYVTENSNVEVFFGVVKGSLSLPSKFQVKVTANTASQ